MPDSNHTNEFKLKGGGYSTQDTLVSQPNANQQQIINNTVPAQLNNQVPIGGVKTLKLQLADSLLRVGEIREKQIIQQKLLDKARGADTSKILYRQFGLTGFPLKKTIKNDPFGQNFLYNLNPVKPKSKSEFHTVFIESTEHTVKKGLTLSVDKQLVIKPKQLERKVHFDWVTIILLASLMLIVWVRLFNKKYLVSVIKSLLSYKESNVLLREKNSVMERASFLINLLFINNLSLFSVQLAQYYEIPMGNLKNYMLYFIMMGSILAFNLFRMISAFFIGSLFLKQKIFSEYIHNIFLYTKNMGLALFPIIILLQFLPFENLSFITYTGMAIVFILYLIQLARSFQIIIRKNLSIFFMILYLCAFEFTPFLVMYKILTSQG